MRYALSCRDLGMGDDFVVHGDSRAEVIRKMIRHAKNEHFMVEEEFNDPALRKGMLEGIYKEY